MTNKQPLTLSSSRRHVVPAVAWLLCLSFSCGVVGANTRLGLSNPQSNPTSGVSQAGAEVLSLEQGKAIERELKGGQSQSYKITLASGQYAHMVVEQKGIDVALTLFGPDGKPAVSLNIANGTRGSEAVRWIVEAAGTYRLEVRAAMEAAQSGQYEVKLTELRSATEQDQKRVTAQKTFAEAERLSDQAAKVSQEAASKKYEEALSLFKATGDQAAEIMALQRLGRLYLGLSEFPKALEYFNQSLLLSRATGDRRAEAFALKGVGDVLESLSEPQKALEHLNQALTLFQTIADTAAEAATLGNTNWYYATFGGFAADNVYRSTDNGTTWQDITGNAVTGLPSVPVRTLVYHPINSSLLYVGTEIGIFTSEDAGTNWEPTQDGPANVSVDELFWMGGDLIAATHGRGLYRASGGVYVNCQYFGPEDGSIVRPFNTVDEAVNATNRFRAVWIFSGTCTEPFTLPISKRLELRTLGGPVTLRRPN